MKIFVISIYIGGPTFKYKIGEFEAVKTKLGYVVNKESSFGGKTTRLKQSDILKLDSNLRPDLSSTVQFHTWYFEGKEKEAKLLITNAAKNAIDVIIENGRNLLKSFNQLQKNQQ
ncbi:MAG: hypothetical protein V4538_15370 [Bacteroidota bacterium]